MEIAVIKYDICINVAVCGDLSTAEELFALGAFSGADGISPLPGGYGIGDSVAEGVWTKAVLPEPSEEADPPGILPDLLTERISELEAAFDALTEGLL